MTVSLGRAMHYEMPKAKDVTRADLAEAENNVSKWEACVSLA